jgi:N-formylmaleamate deformylase
MNSLLRLLLPLALLLTACATTPTANAPSAAKAPPRADRMFSVKVTGKGKPMILIPGLTCDGAVWDGTVEHFRDRYECHVITIAGFAGQPPIERRPMMESVVADLAEYIRDEGLDRPVIVGHSIGGFTSMLLASTEPSLVGHVISVDGMPFYSALTNAKATEESARPMAEVMRAMMTSMPPAQAAAQSKSTAASMVLNQEFVPVIAAWGAASDQASVAQAMYELMTTDLRMRIANIGKPTLLLVGSNFVAGTNYYDKYRENCEAQMSHAPYHKVVMMDKARHFIMYDDPDGMYAQMEEFLAAP